MRQCETSQNESDDKPTFLKKGQGFEHLSNTSVWPQHTGKYAGDPISFDRWQIFVAIQFRIIGDNPDFLVERKIALSERRRRDYDSGATLHQPTLQSVPGNSCQRFHPRRQPFALTQQIQIRFMHIVYDGPPCGLGNDRTEKIWLMNMKEVRIEKLPRLGAT